MRREDGAGGGASHGAQRGWDAITRCRSSRAGSWERRPVQRDRDEKVKGCRCIASRSLPLGGFAARRNHAAAGRLPCPV